MQRTYIWFAGGLFWFAMRTKLHCRLDCDADWIGTLFGFHLCVRHVFSGHSLQFPTHDVGGESGAEEAAIDGSHFPFVDLFACIGAAEGAELALDPMADHGGFVGNLSDFIEGGSNVTVGDAAGAEVAGDTEFPLL